MGSIKKMWTKIKLVTFMYKNHVLTPLSQYSYSFRDQYDEVLFNRSYLFIFFYNCSFCPYYGNIFTHLVISFQWRVELYLKDQMYSNTLGKGFSLALWIVIRNQLSHDYWETYSREDIGDQNRQNACKDVMSQF